jgi:predicted FMN-binding regulatory protein PaiB
MSLYVPGHFAARDPASAARLFHEHPFATLVTPSAPESFVTHLPLIHVAMASRTARCRSLCASHPHVEAAMQAQSLAIFHGPHAYVTASCTPISASGAHLNYAVVHAHGDRARARPRQHAPSWICWFSGSRLPARHHGMVSRLNGSMMVGAIIGFSIS